MITGKARTGKTRAPLTTHIDIAYVDHLQRLNAEDLAFYPRESIRKAMESNHILHVTENDEPAGYLWFGTLWKGDDTIIYQACIDYELRRQHLGFSLVRRLVDIVKAAGGSGIRLRCGSSSLSNEFWKAAGFYCMAVEPGGLKRQRDLNVWRTDLNDRTGQLAVVPSTKQPDLRGYQNAKNAGMEFPSRFDRSHYKERREV